MSCTKSKACSAQRGRSPRCSLPPLSIRGGHEFARFPDNVPGNSPACRTRARSEHSFPDNPEDYRKNRVPILTYESEMPLSDFPVVAFSIAYELELPGIFEMLDLSGIPLLRQDRTEKHPLIIAGGPLTYSNPAILYSVCRSDHSWRRRRAHPFIFGCRCWRWAELNCLSLFSRMSGMLCPGM